jgi:hypothetical protein
LIINGGSNVGLKPGAILKLLSKGETIIDPDDSTNVLGYQTEEIGSVRIVDVQERFATCEVIDGGKEVKRGDIVRQEARNRKLGSDRSAVAAPGK